MSNTTDHIKSEAARKAEIIYAKHRDKTPIKWGWLCDGFETGYIDCATQLVAAQERIKHLEERLRYVGHTIAHEFNTQDIINFIGQSLAPSGSPTVPICCHKKREMGYLQWHRWAEEQVKNGIEQTQCPVCKLYLFPSEF